MMAAGTFASCNGCEFLVAVSVARCKGHESRVAVCAATCEGREGVLSKMLQHRSPRSHLAVGGMGRWYDGARVSRFPL